MPGIVEEQGLQLGACRHARRLGRDDDQGIRARHTGENARPLRPCQTRFAFLYYCAQEVPQFGAECDRLAYRDRDGPAKWERVTLESTDGRAHEQLEGHHRTDGIPRQTDPRHALEESESE